MARSRDRSRSVPASCASASADRKRASSCDASSFMSTSPFFASAPFSKLISLTMPASSAETTAPSTALTDPTAVRRGAQSSSFTVTLLTVVGGIVCGVLFILPICSALMPKAKTHIVTSRAIAITMPLRRGFAFDCFGRLETALAPSCISEFCLRFEQQAPEFPRHFQLSVPPLRRGHFLWTQHIKHQHAACDGKNQFCHFAWRTAARRVLSFRRPADQFGNAGHRGLQNIAYQIGDARVS